MADSKASQRQVQAREREQRALELRKQGYSYDEIAREIGYVNRDAAYKAVTRVLARLESKTKEEAAHVRVLELERLDRLLKPMMEKAEAGHCEAVDRVLRISERRAKLLGLDMPVKLSPTDPSGEMEYGRHMPFLSDEEREVRVLELLERARQKVGHLQN